MNSDFVRVLDSSRNSASETRVIVLAPCACSFISMPFLRQNFRIASSETPNRVDHSSVDFLGSTFLSFSTGAALTRPHRLFIRLEACGRVGRSASGEVLAA